jgi:hypothetical protein
MPEDNLSMQLAKRVAVRALVLAGIVCRGSIEEDQGDPEAELFRQRVIQWMQRLKLFDEAEPDEAKVLHAPLGALSQQEAADATWRAEGMAVLAWALGVIELPSYDTSVNPTEVAQALGFLNEKRKTVLRAPRLLPEATINTYAEMLFTLHWRLREFSLHPQSMDFETFTKSCWFGPLETEGIVFAKGDLAIAGQPIGQAPQETVAIFNCLVRERYRAANWLRGDAAAYSAVDMST